MRDIEYIERLEQRIEELRTQRDAFAAQCRYHLARIARLDDELGRYRRCECDQLQPGMQPCRVCRAIAQEDRA